MAPSEGPTGLDVQQQLLQLRSFVYEVMPTETSVATQEDLLGVFYVITQIEQLLAELRQRPELENEVKTIEYEYRARRLVAMITRDMYLLGLTEKPNLFTGPIAPIDEKTELAQAHLYAYANQHNLPELRQPIDTPESINALAAIRDQAPQELQILINNYFHLRVKQEERDGAEEELRSRIADVRRMTSNDESVIARTTAIEAALDNPDRAQGLQGIQTLHRQNPMDICFARNLARFIRGQIGLIP